VGRTWEQWLGPLVVKLAPSYTVAGQLRREVAELVADIG